MRTALITGAQGFLGQYISRELAANGWGTIGVDRQSPSSPVVPLPGQAYHVIDLPSAEFCIVLASVQPDLIVHAAGPASVPDSIAQPVSDYEGSAGVLAHVLDAVRCRAPSSKFLLISSAAVYGNPPRLPVGEDSPLSPVSPYGFHRMICEELLKEFSALFNLQTCAVRIFSAYGPGLRRQVLWDICRMATIHNEIVLDGTGEETRDFIHARDIACGIRVIAERGVFDSRAYNLASGTETRLFDLAVSLAKQLGQGLTPRFRGNRRQGDPIRWCADTTRATQLGFRSAVGLDEGLAEYARWFRAQVLNE